VVIDGVTPQDLSQAGWGVIFPESDGEAAELQKALKPLLDRRRDQAAGLYCEYLGDQGYRAGDSTVDFLLRHRAGPGRVDPTLVPYYLLIVGSPEQIPYEFQYGLGYQYAVGRIHFDLAEEYRSYAEAVVGAETETAEVPSSRTVVLFGPRQDEGTRLSADALLAPIADHLRGKCKLDEFVGESATKVNLRRFLGGDAKPDLLFAAGHGLVFRAESPRQRPRQGALVCQEWPGHGPPAPEQVFAAEDVNRNARLQGLIAFLISSHSAGTSNRDDFVHKGVPRVVAHQPFVSSLAQRLLASGALAVVGHVERDWQSSFLWRDTTSQFPTATFAECLRRVVEGGPLGWALEPIKQRYADLAAVLCQLLNENDPSKEKAVAELWTATRDARNYVVVGDSAVRLPVASQPVKTRSSAGFS
jgi:hypothetical protein